MASQPWHELALMRFFSPAGVASATLNIAAYVLGFWLLDWLLGIKPLSIWAALPLAIFAHFIAEPMLSKILHRPWLRPNNASSERK
jgi:hypothetical protein